MTCTPSGAAESARCMLRAQSEADGGAWRTGKAEGVIARQDQVSIDIYRRLGCIPWCSAVGQCRTDRHAGTIYRAELKGARGNVRDSHPLAPAILALRPRLRLCRGSGPRHPPAMLRVVHGPRYALGSYAMVDQDRTVALGRRASDQSTASQPVEEPRSQAGGGAARVADGS